MERLRRAEGFDPATNQPARSTVPLEYRSIVAARRGVAAPVAVLIALGFTGVGIGVDALLGNELTATFSALYFLGCVAAVLAVRHRGLFTAAVQPPLIMAASVPVAAVVVSGSSPSSLKDMLLNVAIPMVDRFPVMLAASIVVLVLAVFRWMTGRVAKPSLPEDRRPTREPRVSRRTPPPAPDPTFRTNSRAPRPDVQSDTAYRQPTDQTRARLEARRARANEPVRETRRQPRRQWGTPALATPNRINDAPAHPGRLRYRDEPRG
ncbi:DUF6542 domain-containing protein [Smaragdicoccus niigatensis]|uniref:DUF6542 domain-containing protein n=1 Tax=Smaragdicoccus niigatensis TaxID=359359 RepID=UPI0003AAC53A|nr:DUF6542 domain-containing protein [Smaragdicoccus niigatensis]